MLETFRRAMRRHNEAAAQNLRPHYAAQAKERMNQGRPKEGVEKIPQVMTAAQRAIIALEKHPQPTKSRDQAGKAAGVKFDSSVKVSCLSDLARN